MRVWSKLCFACAAVLFALFLIGVSGPGQRYLIGTQSADHMRADDQVMGAGLAPVVYCLFPSVALAVVGLALHVVDRRRRSNGTSS